MTCACPKPTEHPNPRCSDTCVKCGRALEGDWLATSESMGELHDLLLEGRPIHDYAGFRQHAEAREFAGRTKFGLAYLSKDNCADGLEEAADGGNYSFFEIHKARREGEDPDITALCLDAAYHFAQAHASLRQAMASRAGAPGVHVDE